MATHSSIFAWKIPWTQEPCWLQVHGVAKESDTTEPLSMRALSQSWLRQGPPS